MKPDTPHTDAAPHTPRLPAITWGRLFGIAAAIAAVPALLFALEHPTAAATALLTAGALATAYRSE